MGRTDNVSTSSSSFLHLHLHLHLLLLLLLLLLLPSAVPGLSHEVRGEGADDVKKLLEQMVSGVEKTLNFFAEDYSSINVDGLFGMRVAQGQLLEAQKECESSGPCPDELNRHLQTLVDRTETAAQAAIEYVKAEDPEYFRKFLQLVDKPFHIPYTTVNLQDLGSTPPGSDSSYNEETGDACMARIMGTFVDEAFGRTVEECNMTEDCWNFMTRQETSGYAITHQLLYFSFIQKQGCTERVEAAMKANVLETQEHLCRSIYNEAVEEVMDDKVDEIFQDLFLEQVLLCGTLGFENFMRSDWMRMVLTWQKPGGCFSVENAALLQKEEQLVEAQERDRQLMDDLKQEARMIEIQHGTGRKLLRERIMQGDCLSHKSGLAFGTMGLFVRYLVHQNIIVP